MAPEHGEDLPEAASQTRAVLSLDAVTTRDAVRAERGGCDLVRVPLEFGDDPARRRPRPARSCRPMR